MIGQIIGSLGGLEKSYIQAQTTVKTTEAKIKQKQLNEIYGEQSAIEASEDSWKDEAWVSVFVLIIAASSVTSFQDTMARGFANFETNPLDSVGNVCVHYRLLWNTNNERPDKMKEIFVKYFDVLLKYEGGFFNHPEGLGGATNLGVTKRVMQEFLGRALSMGEMKAITPTDVKLVYKKVCL